MKIELENSSYFKNLDWGRLKTFYYVAKEGNISSAASFLNLTQSPLSRQISSLEAHLGYPLFVRHVKGVALTRKGEDLFKIVEQMFVEVKQFAYNNHAHENQSRHRKRKIRVAATSAVTAYILNAHLLEYNDSNPNIIFEVIANDKVPDIFLNDIDIAIRPYDYDAKNVIQEPLLTLEKKLYASNEYLEKYGMPKDVTDLGHHHLITNSFQAEDFPFADIHWILKLGMPKGKLHEPSFLSNSLECMMEAAKKGKGIISGYEEMSILREAKLINILPELKDKKIIDYIIYPIFLKKDEDICNIKNYLQSKLRSGNISI